jgi:hypothetical protein
MCLWTRVITDNLHEAPLHDRKVGIWRGISARRIIGPVFFVDTLHWERYINQIFNSFFFPELTEEERLYGYCQQDLATAHTAGNCMATISDVFGDGIIIVDACGQLVTQTSRSVIFICGVVWKTECTKELPSITWTRRKYLGRNIQYFPSRAATCAPERVFALQCMFTSTRGTFSMPPLNW